jgi:hypothetical protein
MFIILMFILRNSKLHSQKKLYIKRRHNEEQLTRRLPEETCVDVFGPDCDTHASPTIAIGTTSIFLNFQ